MNKKLIMSVLTLLILLVVCGAVSAKTKDVVGVDMVSPSTTQTIGIGEYFTMTCSAVLSGNGGPPTAAYTGQWCDNAGCTGSVNTIEVGTPTSDVVSLESGAENPESKIATEDWSYLTYGRNDGTVYIRCKIVGGSTCSGGCYSGTEQVNIGGSAPGEVLVETYQDSAYTKEFKFYENNHAVYVEAEVIKEDDSACTNCDVTAYFKINAATEDSITLNHVSNGIYRGTWTTDVSNTNGVYLVDVSASNSYGSANGDNNMHLYAGSNVAAYEFDFDQDGNLDSVMENKHMVIVTYKGNPITYLYQKDENQEYTFNSITGVKGKGEIASDAYSAISSLQLSQTGEALTSASLTASASIGGVDNEVIITGVLSNFTLWEYNEGSGGYDLIVNYDPPIDIYETFIGDVDNDGENEVVSTSAYTGAGIAVWDYNTTTKQLDHIWNHTTPTVDDPQINDAIIGNLDTDEYIEFAAIEDGKGNNLYIFYNDTPNAKGFSNISITLASGCAALEAASMDGDDELELFVEGTSKIRVFDYNSTSGGYDNIVNITPIGTSTTDHLDSGDLTGDGIPNLIGCGNGGDVYVVNYSSGAYEVIWYSPLDDYPEVGFMQSCAVGDFDNDGQNDIMGDVRYDSTYPYTWYWVMWSWNGSTFEEVWNSSQIDARTSGVLMGEVTEAGDFDNDGYIEFGVGDAGYSGLNNWTVYASETGSPPILKEFSSGDSLTLNHAFITVGDIDNDASTTGTSLQFDITMGSEDVDYLEYTVYDIDTNEPLSIFSPISGTLGNSVNDDRYHLEDGTDALISSLTANQWTDFVNSDYSLVYDSSTSSDAVDNLVISWIRFTETAGISFEDVGLWSNGAEGLRIRYDASQATLADEISYLLAFTTGNYNTIHQWISTIQGGQLPDINFMTAPDLGQGTMTLAVNQPVSESDYDIDVNFNSQMTVSCTGGDCGYVTVKLQYCEGASCTGWQDAGSATAIATNTTSVLCSANLLNNTQCNVSWTAWGSNGGTYRINGFADSNISEDVRDATPNIVYINELQVVINEPLNGQNINLDENFTLNGTVSCLGKTCGNVSAYAQDNETGSWTNIGSGSLAITGSNPFSCGVLTPASSCIATWILSSSVEQDYWLRIFAESTTLSDTSEVRQISIIGATPALDVTVATDKAQYNQNEWVYTTTTVKDSLGDPAVNASVTVNITKSDDSLAKTCSGLSDSSGEFSCDYKVKNVDPTGIYTVSSDASKTGYDPGHGEITFEVLLGRRAK